MARQEGTLEGKVVFITGASRGIGRAIALRLAREQPQHVLVGYCSNYEAARSTVGALEEHGVEASLLRGDVSRPEILEQMFGEIEQRCGGLDVFVSNAARATFRPLEELSLKSWQRTQDLNSRAFFLGGKLAAELMRRRGGGHIIGVSSLGAHKVAPGYAALGVAKAALETSARYMAVEFAAWGVHVNVVCGGLIDTESVHLHPDYDELARQVAERTPAGRIGEPEDLAGVVAFLCSPDGRWIRGQTLIVDGGYSIVS